GGGGEGGGGGGAGRGGGGGWVPVFGRQRLLDRLALQIGQPVPHRARRSTTRVDLCCGPPPHGVRQVLRKDGATLGHHQRVLNRVAQLADVAWPPVAGQRRHRGRIDHGRRLRHPSSEITREQVGQERDLGRALAQRRHLDHERAQPEV